MIRPVRGFKTLKTAYATIKGFEVMRALRKGQAEMFALQGGIVGEARIVERAFGVGPDSAPVANAVNRLRNSRILVSLSAERRVPDGNGLCGSNSFDPDRGFQVSRPRKVEGELHAEPRFGG